MANLNSLPVELLRHGCTYLGCKDVLQLSLANRYLNSSLYASLFNNVALQYPLNLQLFLTAIEQGQKEDISYGLKTRSLKFAGCPITYPQLQTLLDYCPYITELEMDSTTWIYICPKKSGPVWNPRSENFRQCLKLTFSKYNNLTSLSFNLAGYMSQTIDIHQLLPLLSGLTTLKLLNVFHVFTMADLEKVHTHCPKLVDLTLSGFSLNRVRPVLPIIQNHTTRRLTLQFASGWTYYFSWLWYIGHKYLNLTSLVCQCTSPMGIRSSNITDDQDMMDGFTIFAEQHAMTLKKLEFINLSIDIRLMQAMNIFSTNANTNTNTANNNNATELMDWETDGNHDTIQPQPSMIPTPPSTAITTARFSNQMSCIQSEVFLAILQYVQHSVHTLNVSWPPMRTNNLPHLESLSACKFLTDLTIELPNYVFGVVNNQGVVPFDQILASCPNLTSLRVIHGKVFIVGDSMAKNHAQQLNYPLKTLVFETVYIPTGFFVMENHGLLNLESVSLDHCVVYELTVPLPTDPSVMVDWIFPNPFPTNGDSLLSVCRRPLSVRLYHVHFVNPENERTTLYCDYISLSQYGKCQENSWSVRSMYAQKMVSLTSPMFRRKSGQLKRKNNRRQIPSEYYECDAHMAPKVGILISCHSIASLSVNGCQMI